MRRDEHGMSLRKSGSRERMTFSAAVPPEAYGAAAGIDRVLAPSGP